MKKSLALTTAAIVGLGVLIGVDPAHAQADTDVVFIGGTATGMVPFNPTVPQGFTNPLITEAIDTATSVRYDGAPWANPHAATPTVREVIAAQDQPVTVIGLSKGAQVARATEALDPNLNTKYVLVGDPDDDRGFSRAMGWSAPKKEFTHDTTLVVAEYDGAGDFPDRPNFLAAANAMAGWQHVHPQYGNGSANDPLTRLDEAEVTETKNANGTTTTRKLIPTRNLPITQGIRNTLKRFGHTTADDVVDKIDKGLRPHIDAGYSRNDDKASTPKKDETSTKSDSDKSDAGNDDNGGDE